MTDQTMAGVCADQVAAGLGAELVAVVDRITALDTSRLSGQDAAGLVSVLSEQTSRLSGLRLGALTTVSESGVWGLDGSRSPTAWLARVERSGKAAAGGALKTAKGLLDLPATHAAVLEGSVPVRHAEAMTRTCLRTPRLREALTDPDCGEEFLLAHAHLGLDAFRVLLNTWAVRADPDAADAAYREDQARHQLLLADTTDGTEVTGKLSPLGGETVRAALLAHLGIPAKDDPRSHGQRLHDALIALAAAALDGGTLGRHASVRPQIVVHVDYPTYRGLLTPTDESAAGLPLGGAGGATAQPWRGLAGGRAQRGRMVGKRRSPRPTRTPRPRPRRRPDPTHLHRPAAPCPGRPRPRLPRPELLEPTTLVRGPSPGPLAPGGHDHRQRRTPPLLVLPRLGPRPRHHHHSDPRRGSPVHQPPCEHVGTTYPHHDTGPRGPITHDLPSGQLLAFPGLAQEPAEHPPTTPDPWNDD